jgi:translocator protein
MSTPRAVPRPPLLAVVGGVVVATLLVAGTAFVGGAAPSGSGNAWYATLEKAPFNPPDAVFPIAWTTLYVLMVVSAALVWRAAGARLGSARRAATLFVAQLALNGLWSWVFFAWHRPRRALIVLAVLWILVAAMIAAYRRHSRVAAWLQAPYLAWLTFALVLNGWIVAVN